MVCSLARCPGAEMWVSLLQAAGTPQAQACRLHGTPHMQAVRQGSGSVRAHALVACRRALQ